MMLRRLGSLLAMASAAIGATALVAGCNYAEIAKADFGEHQSCPADRITVTKLEYGDPLPVAVDPPPADVAADPARLAVWNRNHGQAASDAHDMSSVRDAMADHSFRVDGCGARGYYFCAQCRGSGCRQESSCHEMDRNSLQFAVGRTMITP